MGKRNFQFTVGGWYHCYNRSIENRIAFENQKDYQRFLELLYLANDKFPLRRDDMGVRKFEEVLRVPRGKRLVAIGAFCLMPGHFHLVLKEVTEGGITSFMRKIGTAYTLYFNAQYGRVGNLFLKPFQSRDASVGNSFKNLISYVHSNPAVLYEPGWKARHVVDHQFLEEHLIAYPYASLGAYAGMPTPIGAILDAETVSDIRTGPIQKMLQEARQYCPDASIP